MTDIFPDEPSNFDDEVDPALRGALEDARDNGAHPLSAQQAEDRGLIWKALADDTKMGPARTMTAGYANGPTAGPGLSKVAFQAAATDTLDDHLELEAPYMEICGESPDYAEGVSAFFEKCAPAFEGRSQ